jgi:hypothetical protein
VTAACNNWNLSCWRKNLLSEREAVSGQCCAVHKVLSRRLGRKCVFWRESPLKILIIDGDLRSFCAPNVLLMCEVASDKKYVYRTASQMAHMSSASPFTSLSFLSKCVEYVLSLISTLGLGRPKGHQSSPWFKGDDQSASGYSLGLARNAHSSIFWGSQRVDFSPKVPPKKSASLYGAVRRWILVRYLQSVESLWCGEEAVSCWDVNTSSKYLNDIIRGKKDRGREGDLDKGRTTNLTYGEIRAVSDLPNLPGSKLLSVLTSSSTIIG